MTKVFIGVDAATVSSDQTVILDHKMAYDMGYMSGKTTLNMQRAAFMKTYRELNVDNLPAKEQGHVPEPKKRNNYFREQGNRKHWGK